VPIINLLIYFSIALAVATNKIWSEISEHLNYKVSSNAIHTFVQLKRHGIWEKLGFSTKKTLPIFPDKIIGVKNDLESGALFNILIRLSKTKLIYIYLFFLDEFTELSNDDDCIPQKKFVFTLSAEEWQQIQPQEISYKLSDKNNPIRSSRSYVVLPKGTWTPVLAEHFWVHTELPCCISFKRAKVFPNGQVYVKVVGRCSVCESYFEGFVSQRPAENAK